MPILSQPAFGPKLSIGFITGGALIDVWTLVWRYTIAPDVLSPSQQFWFWGLLLSGVTFLVIGAFLGSIGRAARKAELPPAEALPAEANIQANAAANPHPAVAGAVAVPGATPAAPGVVVPAPP
ncbi:MAG TPA: hypothetical protein VKE74_17560, partial [Gemmataceae bacterium]|nr:hypothetical protein [Gemmataceae bacterium]